MEVRAEAELSSRRRMVSNPMRRIQPRDEPATDEVALLKLAAWCREFAERAGNPTIWECRMQMGEDLEAEARNLVRGDRDIARMRADNAASETLAEILHVPMSPSALRSEARRLREMAKTASGPGLKQELAAQALDLAQRAEVIARWREDPESLPPVIERCRAILATGGGDTSQRQVIRQMLRDAEQLNARLSDLR